MSLHVHSALLNNSLVTAVCWSRLALLAFDTVAPSRLRLFLCTPSSVVVTADVLLTVSGVRLRTMNTFFFFLGRLSGCGCCCDNGCASLHSEPSTPGEDNNK